MTSSLSSAPSDSRTSRTLANFPFNETKLEALNAEIVILAIDVEKKMEYPDFEESWHALSVYNYSILASTSAKVEPRVSFLFYFKAGTAHMALAHWLATEFLPAFNEKFNTEGQPVPPLNPANPSYGLIEVVYQYLTWRVMMSYTDRVGCKDRIAAYRDFFLQEFESKFGGSFTDGSHNAHDGSLRG